MKELAVEVLIYLVVFGGLFSCYLAFDAVRSKLEKR